MLMVLAAVVLLLLIIDPVVVPRSSIRRLLKTSGEAVPAPNMRYPLPYNWIGFALSAKLFTVR